MNAATMVESTTLPADVFITDQLLLRPERAPNLRAEVAGFCELSQILAADPRRAVRRFMEIAMRLCDAGSAGLSLLRTDHSGQEAFHWEAISGALHLREGGGTSRHFSPSGLCLDAGTTVLVSRPERAFEYLADILPAIVETLIVPLYDTARRPLGTIWIVHHDTTGRFCVNDVRIVEQLAIHLVLALKLVREAREHKSALASLVTQRATQQTVTRHLVEERNRRERAEVSETGIRAAMVFKDAVILEAHHRVKNTLQIAASVLSLQARATESAEVRSTLNETFARLHVLAKVHELLYTSADSLREIPMLPLLETMGDALRKSFAEASRRVNLRITSDQMLLAADDAIPLALLANEAITNDYKHAFPDDYAGEISVDLSCLLESSIVLRITDSGIGIGTTGREGGLGLRLIRSFAEQLRGELTFVNALNAKGTMLTLTIPRGARQAPGFIQPTSIARVEDVLQQATTS